MSIKKSLKIKKEMTIGQVLKERPQLLSVFAKYGLHCLGCAIGLEETLEEAAEVHQINLKNFLKDLDKTINE